MQPLPKLGPWRDNLDRMLTTNAGRSARERLTLIRIYEALRGLGYEGGYDAVRRYAKTWKRERASVTALAFVPLSFAPGEAYQFDWSHEIVLIGGTTVTKANPVTIISTVRVETTNSGVTKATTRCSGAPATTSWRVGQATT